MSRKNTNWLAIGVILLAGLFSAAQFGKYTLTFEELKTYYGIWSGFVVSCVGVIGIVFGAVGGGRVASFGLKRTLVAALFAGGVLSLMQMPMPVLSIQIGLRGLEGFSHLAVVIAAPTLMASLSNDHDRPVVMGIWASFFGVALAILAVLLPSILSFGGLPAVLLSHAIGMWIMAGAIWLTVPGDTASQRVPKSFLAEHIAIYTSPRAVIGGAGFVFYTLLYIALIAVLPEPLGLNSREVGMLPLVSLISTFGAGWIARWYAPPLITIVGFGLVIVSLLVLLASPNLPAALFVFLTAGLIPGACFATIPFFNSTLDGRALATGSIAQLGNVGTTLGTPIFVFAIFWGGLEAVVFVAIVFCTIGMGLVHLLWKQSV